MKPTKKHLNHFKTRKYPAHLHLKILHCTNHLCYHLFLMIGLTYRHSFQEPPCTNILLSLLAFPKSSISIQKPTMWNLYSSHQQISLPNQTLLHYYPINDVFPVTQLGPFIYWNAQSVINNISENLIRNRMKHHRNMSSVPHTSQIRFLHLPLIGFQTLHRGQKGIDLTREN